MLRPERMWLFLWRWEGSKATTEKRHELVEAYFSGIRL